MLLPISDIILLEQIARRAAPMLPEVNRLMLSCDLFMAHRACPLMLRELLGAPTDVFMADIVGIVEHISRAEAMLIGFVPAYAKRRDCGA